MFEIAATALIGVLIFFVVCRTVGAVVAAIGFSIGQAAAPNYFQRDTYSLLGWTCGAFMVIIPAIPFSIFLALEISVRYL